MPTINLTDIQAETLEEALGIYISHTIKLLDEKEENKISDEVANKILQKGHILMDITKMLPKIPCK